MKKIVLFLFSYTLSLSLLIAQGTVGSSQNTYSPVVIPPSPNAASLGKYGEIPVSNYTGIPSINIPLIEAKNKDISVAVSLSYHPGIKVEEFASLVGLGWSLNAGGMISRSIIGGPDDQTSKGYLFNNYTPDNFFSNDSPLNLSQRKTKYNEVESMVQGSYFDLQPDVFYFSFEGNSGKFYIDKSTPNKAFTIVKQNIVIEPIYGDGITGFNVFDDNGNKYVFGFGDIEKTASYNIGGEGDFFVTSWMLKEIISTNGTKISFEYENYNNYYLTKPFEVLEIFRANQTIWSADAYIPITIPLRRSQTNTYVQGKQLKKIKFENGYITFVKDVTERRDLKGSYPLKEISLYDNANSLIKSFKLTYNYFNENTANIGFNGYTIENSEPVRLKLEEIQQYGNQSDKKLPPYKFTYFPGNIGGRFSNSQDHWGYYNEEPNSSLIPSSVGYDNGTYRILGDANRSPKLSSTKIGVLQKIDYPTGGSTEFDYELNECFTQDFKFAPLNFQEISSSTTDYNVLEEIQTSTTVNPIIRNNVNISSGAYTFEVLGNLSGTFQGLSRILHYSTRFYLKNLTTNKVVYENFDPSFFLPNPNCSICTPPVTYLESGLYQIKLELLDNDEAFTLSPADGNIPFVKISMKGKLMALNVDYNKKIGGLRIKTITTNDALDPTKKITKTFSYLDINNNLRSSGKLVNTPNYFSINKKEFVSPNVGSYGTPAISSDYEYITIQSNSQSPLTSTRGGSVGYEYVEVLQGTNGKELYQYTTAIDYPEIVDKEYPFTPNTDFDQKRGVEVSSTIFKKNINSFQKVIQIDNTFSYITTKQNIAVLQGCKWIGYEIVQGTTPQVICKDPIFKKYKIEAGWMGKTKKIEQTF